MEDAGDGAEAANAAQSKNSEELARQFSEAAGGMVRPSVQLRMGLG